MSAVLVSLGGLAYADDQPAPDQPAPDQVQQPVAPSDAASAEAAAVAPSQPSSTVSPALDPALSGDASELATHGTLVTSTIAKNTAQGFTVGDGSQALSVTPVGVDPSANSAQVVNETAAKFDGTQPSTDTVERPTALGLETFQELRDPNAPQTFAWKIDLKPGEHLTKLDDRTVAVVAPQAQPEASLLTETPGTAEDSNAPTATAAPTNGPGMRSDVSDGNRAPTRDAPTGVLGSDGNVPGASTDAFGQPNGRDTTPTGEHAEAPSQPDSPPSEAASATNNPDAATNHPAGDAVSSAPTTDAGEVTDPQAQLASGYDQLKSVEQQTADRAVAVIAAPWAKDASGNDVPASLDLQGDTVTLTVQHQSAQTVYPVVADPIFEVLPDRHQVAEQTSSAVGAQPTGDVGPGGEDLSSPEQDGQPSESSDQLSRLERPNDAGAVARAASEPGEAVAQVASRRQDALEVTKCLLKVAERHGRRAIPICVPIGVGSPRLIDSKLPGGKIEHKIGVDTFGEIQGFRTLPNPLLFLFVTYQRLQICTQVQDVNDNGWRNISDSCVTKADRSGDPLVQVLSNGELCVPGTRNYRTRATVLLKAQRTQVRETGYSKPKRLTCNDGGAWRYSALRLEGATAGAGFRRALQAFDSPPGDIALFQAHHIIPATQVGADRAQAVGYLCQQRANDPEHNGVFLRSAKAARAGEGGQTANTPGYDSLPAEGQARIYHPSVHTAAYFAEVARFLAPAERRGGNGTYCDRPAFVARLAQIKQALVTGGQIGGEPLAQNPDATEQDVPSGD